MQGCIVKGTKGIIVKEKLVQNDRIYNIHLRG